MRGVSLSTLHPFSTPLTRIIIGIAFFITVPPQINKWILKPALTQIIPNESVEQMIRWTISIFLVIFLYIILFKIYERRKISEFAFRPAGRENIMGFLLGGLLVGCIILVLMISGSIGLNYPEIIGSTYSGGCRWQNGKIPFSRLAGCKRY